MPLFFQPENIYRKNIIQNQTYKATPEYIDEINKIYGETNPIKKYNDFNKLKNKNISDSLLQLGNKIDNEILSNINTVSELANNSNNILKVLPRFEELVKIYEQLPSIKISTALDNVKTTYINNLKSGEIETLAEFKAKYSTFNPNSSNIIEAQKLQEIGNSIIIYIQTRLKIAKETEDILWGYIILQETKRLYNPIQNENKLPTIENKIRNLLIDIDYMIEEYKPLKTKVENEMRECENIFNSTEYNIETKIKELDEKFSLSKRIKKSIKLQKHIIEFQNKLVINYYNKMIENIKDIVFSYKNSNEHYKALNNETIPRIKIFLEDYLEKDFSSYFVIENYLKVKKAYDYLNTITTKNIKYVVKIIQLISPIDLGEISILIDTYENNEIKSNKKVSEKSPIRLIDKYIYELSKEVIFPYQPNQEIIISIKSNDKFITSISSKELATSPLSYNLPNEKGNHFLIFNLENINFEKNNTEYTLELKIDSSELPEYPLLLVELLNN